MIEAESSAIAIQLAMGMLAFVSTMVLAVLTWFAIRVVHSVDEARTAVTALSATMKVLVESDKEQWIHLKEGREKTQSIDVRLATLEARKT